MISTASTFTAIDRIGLSMSTGLLSGTSVIVSFLFGAVVQGEAFSRTWLAVCAIFILLLAIIAYAAAGQLASTADQEVDQGTMLPLVTAWTADINVDMTTGQDMIANVSVHMIDVLTKDKF